MTSLPTRRLSAIATYQIMVAIEGAAFLGYATLSSVYRINEAGLNALQLILVGTVLEATLFLFEIPTGVVADVYSRRLSLIIGYFLEGLGFIVEGLFPVFGVILAAQVLWGFGYTFTSGAQEAWIADELENRGVGRVFLRGAQIGQAGALVGIGASVALGSVDLALPLIAGGLLFIALAMVLRLIMPERGFRPRPREERRSWTALGQTFVDGTRAVRRLPVLALILVIALLLGAASEPLDRFWQLHLLTNFAFPSLGSLDPIVWFGIISAGGLVLGIGATALVQRLFDVDDSRIAVRTLSVANAALIGAVVVFALTSNFALALAVIWVARVVRRVAAPVSNAWLNQYVDSSVRATMFSIHSQSDAIGQVAAGPALGAAATATTVRVGLLGAAALLVPVQGLYVWAARLRRDRQNP